MGNPSSQSNGPLSQELYSQGSGTSSSDPFINVFSQRDPTALDFNYPVKKRWINFGVLGPKEWILENFTNITSPTNIAGQTQANWVLIASGTSTNLSLTGNNAVPVFPTANNINVVGDGTTVTVTGNPVTSTLTVSLIGGGAAIERFNVQTGTTPVVPTAGAVTINGALVVAGTNPVRTDGTGLSTYAVEVQTSQAIATTNATNVGLSAFSSAQFTVDANGFVQLVGGTTPPVLSLTGDDAVAVTPSATGTITLHGVTVANATNAKAVFVKANGLHEDDIQVQVSAAIASTNIANVGLAAFNSAQFTVDANGFVSISNFSPFSYTAITHNGTNPSPYTVTATDEYISVDTTATTPGTVTILLPNSPTQFREFVIKDRTGAASTNHILVTTVGGTVTIDGETTYTIAGNYGAIQLLWNGTSYEVF